MKPRYFTIEEANGLLPVIRPLLAQLMETQAMIATQAQEITPLLKRTSDGIGTAQTSKMVQQFDEVEGLLVKIQAHGVIIKNANVGLIDFLADFNGRDVFLCWKFGEPTISHYHELHGGFNGRKPLPTLPF